MATKRARNNAGPIAMSGQTWYLSRIENLGGLTERYMKIVAEYRVALRAHGTHEGGRLHENLV
jgi:hypothetical protein